MAAQVLSGTGNVSYTNNTGQNVRVIVNYLSTGAFNDPATTLTLPGGVSISIPAGIAFGKNLAFADNYANGFGDKGSTGGGYDTRWRAPTEFAIANGDTFNFSDSLGNIKYNILVIPESG